MEEDWERLQCDGAEQISEVDRVSEDTIHTVAGLDIQWISEKEGVCVAAVLQMSQGTDAQPQIYHHRHETTVPYRAGFLGFREVDAYTRVIQQVCLEHKVDCVLVDGNGRLHPRHFGSACQFGLAMQMPTIGVAKTLHRCCQNWTDRSAKDEMNRLQLEELDLEDAEGQVLGRAVRRTVQSQSPVFVSVGHHISLGTACSVVKRLLKHSVPEPLRLADIQARRLARL